MVDGALEEHLEEVNDAPGQLKDARVRAEVYGESVRLLRDLYLRYDLVDCVERRSEVLEPKRYTSHDALGRVSREEEGVGMSAAVEVECKLGLGEILDLVDVEAVDGPGEVFDRSETTV